MNHAEIRAAIRRMHKAIDRRIANELWKPGKPHPNRSVGQKYKVRHAKPQ